MWRGVSLRTFGLLLGGPFIVDLMVVAFSFWMNVQAVRMKIPPVAQSWIGVLFALGYMSSAFVAGRWVHGEMAHRLVWRMALLTAVIGMVIVLLPSFPLYLAMSLALGLCVGHYFTPFQIAMGKVQPFHTLAWTIAIYNMSWGLGATLGPTLKGVGELSPWVVVGLIGLLGAAHTVIFVLARSAPSKPQGVIHATPAFASTPRMRLLGWIASGVASAAIAGLGQTLWPALATARGLSSKWMILGGVLLFLPIPVLALLWARCRHQLEHPKMLLTLVVIGLVSSTALIWPVHTGWMLLCVSGVGVAASGIYYHGIYYSNADPHTASKSVGIYESSVGLGNFLGPMLLGALAWTSPLSSRPYWAMGTLWLITLAIVVWGWQPRRVSSAINATAQ